MKTLASLFFFFMLSASVLAQKPTITATVDKNIVAAGGTLKLTLTATDTRASIQNPDMKGFRIVQGPFEQSSFSYTNGRMTNSVGRTYVLQALKEGKFEIGPALIKDKGVIYKSKPIVITVTKGTPPANQGGNSGSTVNAQNRDIFISLTLNKKTAYVGEQLTATYILYSRFPSVNFNKQELPKLNGFFTEEIDLGGANWEPKRKTINGIPYNYAILKKQILFPQKAGELSIEPMKIECTVSSGGFFSRNAQKTIYSNKEKVQVKTLPKPAPSDFNGAVGELTMSAIMDRTEVPSNEAVNLKVTFSGRCNLKLIPAPTLDFPSDFEIYEPKIEDRIRVSGSGMSGSRTVNYLIIPRHAGEYDLSTISVSYFDPKTKKYKSLRSNDLRLTVSKGEGDNGAFNPVAEKQDVEALDSDIRYIRTSNLELEPKNDFLLGSAPYMIGMAFPALAFFLLLAFKQRKESRDSDVAGTRKRKANRIAKKRLAAAEAAMQAANSSQFHEELHKALIGYLANKFNLTSAQINKQIIQERSAAGQIEAAQSASMVNLIEQLEMARYAPISAGSDKSLLAQATSLIEHYEDKL